VSICVDTKDIKDTENMTFADFIQNKFKISGKLQDAVIYAIALVDKSGKIELYYRHIYT
jgi:RAB protein geranylgeranyltransferase component A